MNVGMIHGLFIVLSFCDGDCASHSDEGEGRMAGRDGASYIFVTIIGCVSTST